MCLRWYVVQFSATLIVKRNIFHSVESGGAALPHQANVSPYESGTDKVVTSAPGVPR